MRLRHTAVVLGASLLAILVGCTGDDDGGGAGSSSSSSGSSGGDGGSTSSSGGSTSSSGASTSSSGGTADAGDAGDGSSSSGGKGLKGTGTYKGTAFTLDCDFSDFNTGGLMCQALQWYAFCRPVPNKVGDIDLFQLWFHLPSNMGAAGAHDFKGQSGGGLKMGDGMSTPMDQDDANATENVITVVSGGGSAQTDIAGTFSAKWSNGGDGYGEVSGTFDFDCP